MPELEFPGQPIKKSGPPPVILNGFRFEIPIEEQEQFNLLFLLALIELDDPKINKVMRSFGITIEDAQGIHYFPREIKEKDDGGN